MKVKHLLTFGVITIAGLFSIANAQELEDGTYYLRNTQSGKYVAWGANWGTKAVFAEHGADIKVKAAEDGTYQLITGAKSENGSIRPTDGYCDQSGTWVISPVGDGTFTISSATGFFRYDGTDIVAVDGGQNDSGIYWEILTKADLTARMGNANATNPADATHFITAPDFLTQDTRITLGGAWSNLSQWSNSQPRFTGPSTDANVLINNSNAEIWNMEAVDVNQTLTGLPKGTYMLSALGFYRAGASGDAATVNANGSERLNAILYAGDKEKPLMSIFEGVNKNGKVGVSTISGYIPNTNEDAAKYFKEGLYVNQLYFNVEEDGGSVVIGVKKNFKYNEDWVVFDNLDLKYYGDVTIPQAQFAVYIKAYNDALDSATKYLEAQMSEEAMKDLTKAIETNTLSLDEATAEMLSAATENLLSAAEWAKMATLVAQGSGTDFTEVIVNPNFDGNINGWIDTFSDDLNHGYQNNATYGAINEFMECWAGLYTKIKEPYILPDGKLYQIINLPKGEYTLSADIISTQQEVGKDERYISSLDEVAGVNIYAQSDVLFKSETCNATPQQPKRYEFTFSTTGGKTEIGLMIEGTNCNWVVMDNVRLEYKGEMSLDVYYKGLEDLLEEADNLSDAKMNVLTSKELQSAVMGVPENYDEVTDEALLAKYISHLKAAVSKAETSAAFYADIVEYGNNIKALYKVNEEDAMVAYNDDPEVRNFGSLYLNDNLDETKGDEYKALIERVLRTAYSVGANLATVVTDDWGKDVGTVPYWAMHDENYRDCTEWYYNGPYSGDVVSQTITGLKNGRYEVSVDIAASYTYEEGVRDWEGATGEGLSYLVVNGQETTLDVVMQTTVPVGGMKRYTAQFDVLDGEIAIAIVNKKIGANWFVFKVSSINYLDNKVEASLAVSAAKYATFVAPFDVTLPDGLVAYTVNNVTVREDGTACTAVKSIKGTLPANTPVILYSEEVVSETVRGEVVTNVKSPSVSVGLLTGVYEKIYAPKGSYVLQKHGDVIAFYKVDDSANPVVTANRAYLNVPESASNAKSVLFDFTEEADEEEEDDPVMTAITSLASLVEGNYAGIYNAKGAKIDKLQKGLNIIKLTDGRTHKVFVK